MGGTPVMPEGKTRGVNEYLYTKCPEIEVQTPSFTEWLFNSA